MPSFNLGVLLIKFKIRNNGSKESIREMNTDQFTLWVSEPEAVSVLSKYLDEKQSELIQMVELSNAKNQIFGIIPVNLHIF